MSAAANEPELIKDVLLTQEKNDAGIHGLRFFIRGKPWHVTIDDRFIFVDEEEGTAAEELPYLLFGYASDDKAMWAPIVEKAWAKVKGAYYNASGGSN